jgi:hypothetical protein
VLERVQAASKGTPRLINTLCDNLLLEAFLEGTIALMPEMADRIATELGLMQKPVSSLIDQILGEETAEERHDKVSTDWDILKSGNIDQILGFLSK